MAKNNIIVKLQRWMDSKAGQMFLNYTQVFVISKFNHVLSNVIHVTN